jgi:hypothetical protein
MALSVAKNTTKRALNLEKKKVKQNYEIKRQLIIFHSKCVKKDYEKHLIFILNSIINSNINHKERENVIITEQNLKLFLNVLLQKRFYFLLTNQTKC